MNRTLFRNILISLPLICATFRIQAQVSFFQPPTYSGSGIVFIGDFNNDGKQDLLTADGTMNLGNGDGTFTPGTNVSVPTGQSVLAVADFNGDGRPDVLEQSTSTSTLQVFLGNGDATFQAAISTPSGATLSVVAAADLNGDGKTDVIGVFNSSLLVYISKGDGTFSGPTTYPMTATAVALTPGDYNNDGKMDIAVGAPPDEILFLGNGAGTFQTPAKTTSGVTDQGFTIAADFNGDRNLDLAIGGSNHVYLLKGNGDGTFQAPVALLPAPGYEIFSAADLNGDGRLDLIVQQDPTVAEIYLQRSDGTFSNDYDYIARMPSIYHGYAGAPGIAVGDFNSDGKLDVATGNAVLAGNGDGSFQGIQLSPTSASAAVVGDFEKNGTSDVAAISGSAAYILHNNGKALLSPLHTYTLQQLAYGIVTADFNGDGNLDLIVAGLDPVSKDWGYSVLLGNGDGSFQTPSYYPQGLPGNSSAKFVVSDFNNDHKLDLAIAAGDQTFGVLLGHGDGTFAAPAYYADGVLIGTVSGLPPLLAADFNSDGNIDIAVVPNNTSSTATAIFYGNGDGTFQPIFFPTSLTGFSADFTADLNDDGKADLVSYASQIALGNGDGTFTVLPAPSFVDGIADLNGDGKPDVFIGCKNCVNSPTGVQLGIGDGTFGPLIQVPANGYVLPHLFADMNGDGRTDIVTLWDTSFQLHPFMGIGIILNSTAADFELYATTLSPSPVTTGSSAASTLNVLPNFGFNTTVTLSCAGLPSGAVCTFNPPSIAGSAGKSTLTITTNASAAAGTYPVQVTGTAGAVTSSIILSLVVQAAPDFSLEPTSGSPTSQTITAGQTTTFSLDLASSGAFTGTVNFNCAITPSVTPAPTCNVPSSLQISGAGTQAVNISVKTTAPVMSGVWRQIGLPSGHMPFLCAFLALGLTGLWTRRRSKIKTFATPILLLGSISLSACGGGNSSPPHTSPGTPAGTYTVTVTATSGSLYHATPLQVVVQ